jgi:ferredoxin-NADP reductase
MTLSRWPNVSWSRLVDAALRSRFLDALASPHRVDDYLPLFDATWSVYEARARVIEVRRELGASVSLLLAPNRTWRGFRAGQYVQLGVERDGIRHTRCFSISSAPSDREPLRLSMRALPHGNVSSWVLEAAREGDVVWLSQALGDFVLPAELPAKLLLVSAGSGVTPILSMVRELSHAPAHPEVIWLHYGRRETMLEDEALALAASQPWLRFVLTRTDGPEAAPAELRHLSTHTLVRHVGSWSDHQAFVCGPAALLRSAREIFAAHGRERQLHTESFGESGPSTATPPDSIVQRARLTFAKSQREITGSTTQSLLEQAEAAGLTPAFGCRMGICHTCKCKKLSGVVRDMRTGLVSDHADEEIRLCVSLPCSDVALDI